MLPPSSGGTAPPRTHQKSWAIPPPLAWFAAVPQLKRVPWIRPATTNRNPFRRGTPRLPAPAAPGWRSCCCWAAIAWRWPARPVRGYPKPVRGKIGLALRPVERDFGQPHAQRGLGIRKLSGNYLEIRVGLDLRLVFQNRAECLFFVMAGDHDDVQKFLRGR